MKRKALGVGCPAAHFSKKSTRQDTAGDDGGVVCPETGASLPRSRCGGPLYLLSCIKPLDAFTSGAERFQSELVQTFPRKLCILSCSNTESRRGPCEPVMTTRTPHLPAIRAFRAMFKSTSSDWRKRETVVFAARPKTSIGKWSLRRGARHPLGCSQHLPTNTVSVSFGNSRGSKGDLK